MEKKVEDVAPQDRSLVGFTWSPVTSVQGEAVMAAQEGRTPRRFRRGQIREAWSA